MRKKYVKDMKRQRKNCHKNSEIKGKNGRKIVEYPQKSLSQV